MNLLMVLVVVVSSWMTFSVLNELAMAKDGKGCCESKDCGEGMISRALWWSNLAVAVLFTLYLLFQVYEEHGDTLKSHAGKLASRMPRMPRL